MTIEVRCAMGASRTSFAKLQRDRDKKAKAAMKRERREERLAETAEEEATAVDALGTEGDLPPDVLLKMVEDLHADFDAERITFEEFEERKTELFARISV